MNKIFFTTIGALLIALAASAGASYWLALNPPFQTDPDDHVEALETFGESLFEQLHELPEEGWEAALSDMPEANDYYIDWFKVEDYGEAVEDFAVLSSRHKVLATLIDGTPMLELLIPAESMVIEVMPLKGYDRRLLLNRVVTVGAVLLIGLLASWLTLYPIAKRLRRLQSLAGSYSNGDLSTRNTDTVSDAIGKLGISMEAMADRVDGLLTDKEQLVNDQQELMRAVAHEFRAPMARMRFALEMYEGTADFPDEGKQEVSEALEELDGLVTEVLRYARLQRSAPALQKSRVLLTDTMHESARNSRESTNI